MRLKIAERIMELKHDEGLDVSVKGLAMELHPESSPRSAYNTFLKVVNGDAPTIRIDHVPIICKYLKWTPDQLFNRDFEKKNKKIEQTIRKIFQPVNAEGLGFLESEIRKCTEEIKSLK